MCSTLRLLMLSLLGLCCTKQRSAEVEPSAVATVNGEALRKDDFERELSREAQGLEGVGPRTPEQMEPYKRALLDTLIERTLLLQAARSAQIAVSTEEVERRVLALAGEYPAGTFDDVLSQGHTSRQEIQRTARERMVMEKLLNQEVYARLAVTEEDIRRTYAADSEAYTLPEKVHAAQIVVRGLDEAKRLAQHLKEGKKFSDLARLYSQSPDAKVGGDLGTFAKGQMPPAFDEVLFRLQPNQTSEIVTTDYGFHLFRVLEKVPARKRELNEVRGLIEATLLRDLRSTAEREYVGKLRRAADIQTNEPVFNAVSGQPRVGTSKEP